MPTESTAGEFHLTFYSNDNAQTVISPAHPFAIELWMPSMGHGSTRVKIQETSPGQMQVSKVFFIMPGAWEIHFQLKQKDNNEIFEEVSIPFHL